MADDPYEKYTKGADEHDPYAKYGPKAAEDANKPGILESVGRGGVEGLTFGFDNKLGMDKERREASRAANPWAHFAGELLGSAAPMTAAYFLPTGVTQAAAAGRTAQLATRGAGLLRSALVPGEMSTLKQGVGQGVKLGATYGGLSGTGHADVSPEDTATDALVKRGAGALKGATVGAVMGAPFGAAGHGLYRAGQYVGNMFADAGAETAGAGKGALVTATKKLEQDRIEPQQIIDNILSEFPSASDTAQGGMARRFWGNATGPDRQPITREQVEEVVRRAANSETPAQISAAMSPGGKGTGPGETAIKSLLGELEERHLGPLMLPDRASMVRLGSGDNTQMAMRAAAATPGEHLGIAREGLLGRQVGAGSRLGQLFERMLGTSDFEGAAAQHTDQLQGAGARAYGTAFANEQAGAQFNLAPLFMTWEAKFDKMRGVIPDTMRARLDKMMWKDTLADGRPTRAPPDNLEGFMFAREGVRDLIGELPKGNNLRRYLSQFYSEMTDTVAQANPAWKVANDIWRDGMAATDAMQAGANMSTRLNAGSRQTLAEFTSAQGAGEKAQEALAQANRAILGPKTRRQPTADELANATPEQRSAVEQAQARLDAANARQQLFKVGLVRSLNDRVIMNKGETHDLTREMLFPGAQKMLRAVMGDGADQFIAALKAEAAMHRTYKAQFGSQTTPLAEAVKEQTWAPRVEATMLNPLTWINPILRLAHEHAARTINARRNTDLMKLYTETDPLKQLEALRAMQSLHSARSKAGNIVGQPAVGLGAGLTPETVEAGDWGARPPPRRP